MKIFEKIAAILLFIIFSNDLCAQKKYPFQDDILKFKKQDSIHFPEKNQVLFVGSSSFTKWTDVQNYFPGIKILNRGFGGSSLPDVIRYAKDIIFPYEPKQVVIYCGDNDLASSDTITSRKVIERFKELFYLIRGHLPRAHILYISIKPSPSRQRLMPSMVEANSGIKKFLSKKRRTGFVDVYSMMLLPDGNPMGDIFLEDKLHMNSMGYAIWQKAILPYLIK
jgi:lysophospholipase L1-like esterase